MALESENRVVVTVFGLTVQELVPVSPPVVKLRVLRRRPDLPEVVVGNHLPDVPHLQQLILGIRSHVDAISLAGDIGDSF